MNEINGEIVLTKQREDNSVIYIMRKLKKIKTFEKYKINIRIIYKNRVDIET